MFVCVMPVCELAVSSEAFAAFKHRLVAPLLDTPSPQRGPDDPPGPSTLPDADVVRVPKPCALCPTQTDTGAGWKSE